MYFFFHSITFSYKTCCDMIANNDNVQKSEYCGIIGYIEYLRYLKIDMKARSV